MIGKEGVGDHEEQGFLEQEQRDRCDCQFGEEYSGMQPIWSFGSLLYTTQVVHRCSESSGIRTSSRSQVFGWLISGSKESLQWIELRVGTPYC